MVCKCPDLHKFQIFLSKVELYFVYFKFRLYESHPSTLKMAKRGGGDWIVVGKEKAQRKESFTCKREEKAFPISFSNSLFVIRFFSTFNPRLNKTSTIIEVWILYFCPRNYEKGYRNCRRRLSWVAWLY